MPNWVSNVVTIMHKDKDAVLAAAQAIREERWLQWVQPLPEDVANDENEEERYDWRVSNWGTKWDIEGSGILDGDNQYHDPARAIEECVYKVGDDWAVRCTFDTAWSPPVETYQHLSKNGWHVVALYDEGGAAFCGRYSTDDGDLCLDYPDIGNERAVKAWIKGLPKDLERQYDLADRMQNQWLPEPTGTTI